jgi:hypothetical protein
MIREEGDMRHIERPAQSETHGRSKNPAPRRLWVITLIGSWKCVFVFIDVLRKGPLRAAGY